MAETRGSIIRGPEPQEADDGAPFDPFGWDDDDREGRYRRLDSVVDEIIRGMREHPTSIMRERRRHGPSFDIPWDVSEEDREPEPPGIERRFVITGELRGILGDPDTVQRMKEAVQEAIEERIRGEIAHDPGPDVCSKPCRTFGGIVLRASLRGIPNGDSGIRIDVTS